MTELPAEVLAAWGLGEARVERVAVGLINRTYRADAASGAIALQRLHPVFSGEVNLDIEAITDELARKGVPTPRLVRASDGRAFVEDRDGHVWRALTWLDGRTVERVDRPEIAGAAGALVARFHRALDGLAHGFHFTRADVHDTAAHLARLETALRDHVGHPNAARARPVAERILAHAARLPALAALPSRIVHGDLKISNVLFDDALAHGIALVDLDTLAHGTIAMELGDALRSWCNPAGEDRDATLEVSTFRAAVSGYAQAAPGLLAHEEIDSIVSGLETVALELAARFAADAFLESYFGWDPARFESRSEHNRVRAASQLSLAEAVAGRRAELGSIVFEAFGG